MLRKNKLPLFVVVAVSMAALGPAAHADGVGGIFAKANETAQARCVKIFGASIGRVEGYGTGILVSGDGHILTASGVMLSGERTFVVLPDGSRHQAKVERRSQYLQAALLKIDAKTPDFFELSEKSNVKQGDWVLAVSNLFKVADGTEQLSVNLGVVSLRTALEAKRGTQDVPYEGDVYLIDAITSNPGAGGGAVVNVQGQLVGMIGRIIESTSTNTRLNYAVPADLLFKFVTGKPLDGETDVVKVPVDGATAYIGLQLFSLGLNEKRALAYVDRVRPRSPARKAGIKPDDLIVAIGQQTVYDINDYKKIVATLTPDEEVIFLVKRKNDLLEIRVTPTAEDKK